MDQVNMLAQNQSKNQTGSLDDERRLKRGGFQTDWTKEAMDQVHQEKEDLKLLQTRGCGNS